MPLDVTTGAPVVYASFGARCGALLTDGLIVTGAGIIVRLSLGLGLQSTSASDVERLYLIVTVLASWLYYTVQDSSEHQGTFGKRRARIRVTDLAGNRISFGRANGRYFARPLSALPLFAGFLLTTFTKRHQTLHDLIAGTVVVNNHRVGAMASTVSMPTAGGVPSEPLFTTRNCLILLAVFIAACAIPFVADAGLSFVSHRSAPTPTEAETKALYAEYLKLPETATGKPTGGTAATSAVVPDTKTLPTSPAEPAAVPSPTLPAPTPSLQATLSQAADGLNRTLPRMVDRYTELANAAAVEKTLIYNYRLVDLQADEIDPSLLVGKMRPLILNGACSTRETREGLLTLGATLRYTYSDQNRRFIASTDITLSDCDL